MRRPAAAAEALSVSPTLETCGAHPSGVKGVPRMTARARPEIALAGRPAAERASNAGTGWAEGGVLPRFAIRDHRTLNRVVWDGAHGNHDEPVCPIVTVYTRKNSRTKLQPFEYLTCE
jgi:hypothetical protein